MITDYHGHSDNSPLVAAIVYPAATAGIISVCAWVSAETVANLTGNPAPALFGKAIGMVTATLTGTLFYSHWNWRMGRYFYPIDEPEPADNKPVRVELARENGADWIDLPVGQAAARAIINREYALVNNTYPASLIKKTTLDALRAELLKRGLAVKGGRDTVVLNSAGRAVMRRIAGVPSPTGRGNAQKGR